MKKVFSLILMFVMLLSAVPAMATDENAVSQNFKYEIVNGEAHITKYFGNEKCAVVPSELDGYKVTTICEDAFLANDKTEEILISEGITTIESYALYCKNAKKFTFPTTLKETDSFIVGGVVPDGTKIIIQSGMKVLPSEFMQQIKGKFEVILPDTVEEIGAFAFKWSDITKINLENVKLIRSSAFRECQYLKEANLENVEYLGSNVFYECGIENINMPSIKEWDGVKYEDIDSNGTIGVWGHWHHGVHYAYELVCAAPINRCFNLKTVRINYPETEEGYPNLLISECPNIETAVIDNVPKNFNKWDFSCNIEDENPPGIVHMPMVPNATAQYGKMPPNMIIYGSNDQVEAYAVAVGIPFKDTREPKEKEDTIPKSKLFDELELSAEEKGFPVYRNGTNLAVQNGMNYFVISNDEVSYMENRMLKKESIYHDGINVKYPEKAIEAVFGSGLFENIEPEEKRIDVD